MRGRLRMTVIIWCHWYEFSQCARDVERKQKVDGGIEVESAKLIGALAVPNLAGRGVPP